MQALCIRCFMFFGLWAKLLLSASLLLSQIPLQAATYLVNSLGDAGTGTGTSGDLRYCINQANALTGPHVINFTGVSGTITLTSNLPVITREISFLGNTATGYSITTPTIQINAAGAGWGFLFNNAGASGSVLRGLVINRAQLCNIEINNVNNIIIRECSIGLNTVGTASAGVNPSFGVQLINASNCQLLNNVISGHSTHGVFINLNSNGTQLKGNKIGTNLAGTAAVPNTFHGIEINNNSLNTIIGGTLAGEGNIIAGNGHIGLSVVGSSTGTQVISNHIGTNAAGTAALANGEHGIFSTASGALIITNNLISGNAIFGVLLMNANSHVLKGNKIGTNATGLLALANGNAGVSFQSCNAVVVGGTVTTEGNVLSGNGDVGLRFENSSNATVQGNLIGVGANGLVAIPNSTMGIFAIANCDNHLIGGSVAGARNVISANTSNGIQYTTGSDDLRIEGNLIGTDINGVGASTVFGNGQIGILITDNCARTTIGGTLAAHRNVISGNGRLWISGANNGTGVQLQGGVVNTLISGNYIGLAADGTTARGNAENGIVVLGGCNSTTIGGSTVATRNIISSNGFQAVVVNGANAAIIIGNYIGTDVTGSVVRANGQSGVILIFSSNSFVGRANAGEGNIISNNGEEGIHVIGGNPVTIHNNFIGVAANGITPMGNRNGGVFIQGVGGGTNGSSITVGGTGALQPNIIAYSTGTGSNANLGNGFGIGVAHNDQGIRNTFIANKIFCNAGLGIDLNFSGSFGGTGTNGVGNGGKTAPTITSVSSTVTSGTGLVGETVHVYNNVTCMTCQGEIYLGSAVVNASGLWTLTHASVASPSNNSVTATSTALGTSQFSCLSILPVELLSFDAALVDHTVELRWVTASEINNDHFVIERSSDGLTFDSIGVVAAASIGQGLTNYFFIDLRPISGISYYRLRQVDLDGSFHLSDVRTIERNKTGSLSLFPNPTSDLVSIVGDNFDLSHVALILYNVLGVEVSNFSIHSSVSDNAITIDLRALPEGLYLLHLIEGERQYVFSLIKQ